MSVILSKEFTEAEFIVLWACLQKVNREDLKAIEISKTTYYTSEERLNELTKKMDDLLQDIFDVNAPEGDWNFWGG